MIIEIIRCIVNGELSLCVLLNFLALEAADDEANEYDFITIQNILPYDVEFGKTVRSALKTWNMTVQWWLAVNVYKRIPASNKFIR